MPMCNVIFADTYLYMPLSLAQLGISMEMPDQKGYFPFSVLTPEFEGLRFPFPKREAYPLEKMSVAKRAEFETWYEEERVRCGDVFDFAEQLEYYCEVGLGGGGADEGYVNSFSAGRQGAGSMHPAIQGCNGRHNSRTLRVHKRLHIAELSTQISSRRVLGGANAVYDTRRRIFGRATTCEQDRQIFPRLADLAMGIGNHERI